MRNANRHQGRQPNCSTCAIGVQFGILVYCHPLDAEIPGPCGQRLIYSSIFAGYSGLLVLDLSNRLAFDREAKSIASRGTRRSESSPYVEDNYALSRLDHQPMAPNGA
jgi:hypothetical protein